MVEAYVYREGHEDVTITRLGDQVPQISEKSQARFIGFVIGSILLLLVWISLSILYASMDPPKNIQYKHHARLEEQ